MAAGSFALIAHAGSILTADDMSHVRQLARAAIALLQAKREADASEEGDRRARENECAGLGQRACWMVVAAVAAVWAQRDLWEDAIAAMRA